MLWKRFRSLFSSHCSAVLTATGQQSNEPFKLWMANRSFKISSNGVSVHGAHHGTALFNGPGEQVKNRRPFFHGVGVVVAVCQTIKGLVVG